VTDDRTIGSVELGVAFAVEQPPLTAAEAHDLAVTIVAWNRDREARGLPRLGVLEARAAILAGFAGLAAPP
jgi:hypothetical protein